MSKKMTYAQAKMTYELLVAECKRLRSETERHEAQFFAFLMIAERDHERLWRENGCADFEQFIRSNDLCKPYRYCLFRDGVDQAGLDAALANGAHWTMEIGKVRDIKPAELGAFKARAKAFLDVHHTSPSSEVVHDWRIELAPRRDQPARIEKHPSELVRLRAENAELKAENKALTKRISELEAKVPKKAKVA